MLFACSLLPCASQDQSEDGLRGLNWDMHPKGLLRIDAFALKFLRTLALVHWRCPAVCSAPHTSRHARGLRVTSLSPQKDGQRKGFSVSACTKLKSQTGELEDIQGKEKPRIDILDPDFYKPIFRGKGEVLARN